MILALLMDRLFNLVDRECFPYNENNRKKDDPMKYRVHRLEIKQEDAQEKLEQFLNRLEGEVLSIVPYVSPTFQGMGATSKVVFLLIVEKIV